MDISLGTDNMVNQRIQETHKFWAFEYYQSQHQSRLFLSIKIRHIFTILDLFILVLKVQKKVINILRFRIAFINRETISAMNTIEDWINQNIILDRDEVLVKDWCLYVSIELRRKGLYRGFLSGRLLLNPCGRCKLDFPGVIHLSNVTQRNSL